MPCLLFVATLAQLFENQVATLLAKFKQISVKYFKIGAIREFLHLVSTKDDTLHQLLYGIGIGIGCFTVKCFHNNCFKAHVAIIVQ